MAHKKQMGIIGHTDQKEAYENAGAYLPILQKFGDMKPVKDVTLNLKLCRKFRPLTLLRIYEKVLYTISSSDPSNKFEIEHFLNELKII
ncbi:hypothetical protein RCL_jg2250.t1 [Rhizophagus clarus]|uniref:Uncharacterized protein n=1 Tax=Rhizophagus clarus TaxID=94130 RepID=A0A8H3KSD5_9GLOM|nr:hypothetical protein RCL_jg2250.t1 [Rhizophagus clarus]